MRRTTRALRFLTAILAVWCLGCDAFEAIAESWLESPPRAATVASAAEMLSYDGMRAASGSSIEAGLAAGDSCQCVLGDAAVVSVAFTVDRARPAPADFLERPPAVVLPAPEPLVRPPVA